MTTHQINAGGYDTDKARHHHYLRNYEEFFGRLREREVCLLELGVYHGGSLLLWRDYFPRGVVAGLDVEPVSIDDPTGRIRIYQGLQQDTVLLDRIARECAPEGFDIIIDDCSHVGELTRISFWHLFDNHLKPGGLYVVEDWGTGYWDSWVDGVGFRARPAPVRPSAGYRLVRAASRLRNSGAGRIAPVRWAAEGAKRLLMGRQYRGHDYGMVGFVKELVDECGSDDATHPEYGRPPARRSKIAKMYVSQSHVFVVKA